MSESINVKTEMGDHQLETRPGGECESSVRLQRDRMKF